MATKYLGSLLVISMALTHSTQAEAPIAVKIVPVASEMRDAGIPIGNVQVKFADGHVELWTKRGRCLLAKIAKGDHVGWTRYTSRSEREAPENDTLRLMVNNERWVDFRIGYPFIDDWDISPDGTSVIIKARFTHGPARFIRFDFHTQKELEQAYGGVSYSELPAWAQPFADDVP